MRVTIIPEDKWIRRGDDAGHIPEWPFDDANIHAIQWYETVGEIEYSGSPKPLNQSFDDPTILTPYLTALDKHLDNLVRARNELGQFVGDDPTTPDINEAWVEAPAT